MRDPRVKNFLLGTVLMGGLVLGTAGCSSCSRNKDKDKEKTEASAKKYKHANYGKFKKEMCQHTNAIMLETALVEGVELDRNGLCKPYRKKTKKGIDKWTIGFGLTSLDGKPVTKNTRHITIKEAWEKSARFYEEDETYFLMWCYEIGIDGLEIDTQAKAFGLASIMYNASTNLIEDKNSKVHQNRNAALRDLYTKYGDDITPEQVAAVFAQYPITNGYSFYDALNDGNTQDWANALGNFCAEGGGIYWRRWLEGQMVIGNITPKDMLDLPMQGLADFWKYIGSNKSALFILDKRGRIKRVNPAGLAKFRTWAQNPVDKNGIKITRQTMRQFLNSIDPELVAQIENSNCLSHKNETYVLSPDMLNDSSYIAYQDSNYEDAIKFAEKAIKIAKTDKQFGAAHYNAGISYLELGKYGKAVKSLEKSIDKNDTRAAQKKLAEAKEKRKEQRGKHARNWALALGAGAVAFGAARIYRKRTRG